MSTAAELVSRVRPFRRLLLTNSTDTAAPSGTPDTVTEPTSLPGSDGAGGTGSPSGIVDIDQGGSGMPWLALSFFGVGTNGQNSEVYIYGWMKCTIGSVTTWHRELLTKFTFAINTALPGLANSGATAGAAVDNNNFYADAITAPAAGLGVNGVDYRYCVLAGHPLRFAVRVAGYAKVQVLFDVGTMTSANALVRQESGI